MNFRFVALFIAIYLKKKSFLYRQLLKGKQSNLALLSFFAILFFLKNY